MTLSAFPRELQLAVYERLTAEKMKELPALLGILPLTQNEAKNIVRKWYDIDANLEVISKLYPNVAINWTDVLSYLEMKSPSSLPSLRTHFWVSREGHDLTPYAKRIMLPSMNEERRFTSEATGSKWRSMFDFSNEDELFNYIYTIFQHIRNAAENNNASAMLFFLADPHFDRDKERFGTNLFDIAVASPNVLLKVLASPEVISELLDRSEVKDVINHGIRDIHTLLKKLQQEFRYKYDQIDLPGYVDLYRRILLFPVWKKGEAKEITFARVAPSPYINPILEKILIMPTPDVLSQEAQRELVRLINASLPRNKRINKFSKWINSLKEKYGIDHPVLSQIQI